MAGGLDAPLASEKVKAASTSEIASVVRETGQTDDRATEELTRERGTNPRKKGRTQLQKRRRQREASQDRKSKEEKREDRGESVAKSKK